MGSIVIIAWGAIALLTVAIFGWTFWAERKRQQGLERAANELGLAYAEAMSEQDLATFNHFPLAQFGQGGEAKNAIVADSGELRMVLFDYRYTSGSGKNRTVHRQSVVLCSSPSLELPEFSISPERFFHRFAELLGFKDIDFEEDPEFSRQFLLKGADEPAVRELFSQPRRNAFMKFPRVTVEGRGDTFIFYQLRKRRGADQLHDLMEEGFTVFSALGSPAPAAMR